MVDSGWNPQKALYKKAVQQHDAFFAASSPPGQRLNKEDLEQYPDYSTGWRSVVDVEGKGYPVDVLLKPDFPFAKPRVALVDKAKYLQWPHVEKDGGLCLMPSHASTVISVGVELVEHLLKVEAPRLIEECRNGANRGDFVDEFHSYWPGGKKRVRSLLAIKREGQIGCCWQKGDFVLAGESEEQLKGWLEKYLGKRDDFQKGYSKALYVWLEHPPVPAEYPRSGSDFRKLLLRESAKTQQFFFDNFLLDQKKCLVLFGFAAAGASTLGGLWLKQTDTKPEKGFRPGRVPRKIQMMRYHGTRKNIDPVHIQRVDAAWIHARGGEKAINYLQNKTVAIVGCGSVGSLVAETLVKAGVGELSFFDPDHLSWDNIARHALGGRYVDEEKGAALAEYFHKHFPHVHCTHRKAMRWEQAFSEDPEQLSGCDLVISTTGDYHSEAYLNYLKRTMPDFPSVLFGWTEAHACAGHALLVKDLGGCLNCGMDETGNFQDSVVHWGETETMEQIPACGAFYQPYGITDLLPIISMIANLVLKELSGEIDKSLHCVWMASHEHISSYGGKITTYYAKKYHDDTAKMISEDWPLNKDCKLCH